MIEYPIDGHISEAMGFAEGVRMGGVAAAFFSAASILMSLLFTRLVSPLRAGLHGF